MILIVLFQLKDIPQIFIGGFRAIPNHNHLNNNNNNLNKILNLNPSDKGKYSKLELTTHYCIQLMKIVSYRCVKFYLTQERLLYRLREDKKHKEIVNLLLLFKIVSFYDYKTIIVLVLYFLQFYISSRENFFFVKLNQSSRAGAVFLWPLGAGAAWEKNQEPQPLKYYPAPQPCYFAF